MASSKEYLDFILDQLSELDEITHRSMMGEYILYYKKKIFGGIYDDRFLIKSVPSALDYLNSITYELPYEGAKKMILVDNVEDKEYLSGLIKAMDKELPLPKTRRKNRKG